MISGALRRSAAVLVAATCVFALASCAGDEPGPVVTVGADGSAEARVLAEIYAQALARTGMETAVADESAAPVADLDAGRIAVLPARNGALLDRWNPSSSARKPDDVGAAVNAALPQGLSLSDAADGTDLRALLLVTQETAARDNVRTIEALTCANVTAGFVEVPGLAPTEPPRIEGCSFAATVRYPSSAQLFEALRRGDVQVAVLSGPVAATEDFVVLDDKNYDLRAQNVLALFRSGIFDRARLKKLNYVAGELTTEGLVELLGRVEGGTAPADAAREWLNAHGL
ncbi:glycine betaine ABC transporter substrate-binding protein [Nocardia sp. NPDC050413]|uniref:glycine betaine ABC transporter substrate-binding protein n=1 Tax=Nocardia sp. NPDC050413 TaxID=3155784 RepID=UPI0033CE2C75